jgi:pyrroline-5-carboxylate reductase
VSAEVKPLVAGGLGLLGAGNMAEALLRGALRAGLVAPGRVTAGDISPERRERFAREFGARATASNAEVVRGAELLVLCVKPQQCEAALAEAAPAFEVRRHLLISILAGVPTRRLEGLLPAGARVVRAMPNTPLQVGLGASCLCGGARATEQDLAVAERLLGAAGLVLRVEEGMMDAATGLSGSGPAYLCYLIEAMVEAGTAEGFTREAALRLAARTCLGAAKMLEETGLPPEELRRRVSSPGGTTQAALELLEAGEVKKKLVAAVRRAAARSRELGVR